MSDRIEIQAPVIPARVLAFAEAVCAEAKKHGIEQFAMELSPSYGYSSDVPYERRVHGNLNVMFSAKDGRGRPRYKLHVTATTNVTALLIDQEDSSS